MEIPLSKLKESGFVNTQVSVEVPVDAQSALTHAYEVLLSMGKVSKRATPCMDTNLLYARACITRSYLSKYDFVCLITVETLQEQKCRVTLTVDPAGSGNPMRGDNILFMSDLLIELSQRLRTVV